MSRRLGELSIAVWVLVGVLRRLAAAAVVTGESVAAPAAPAVIAPPTFAAAVPDVAAPDRPTAPSGRGRRIARTGLAFVLFAVAVSWAGWLASGGRLFTVGSPSMGEIAPVGSLVVTRPLDAHAALHVGEIVVYHPHDGASEPYVHRIIALLPDGRFRTKGALNPAPDPWIGDRSQVAGRPVAIVPALGWLYRFAAWFGLGAAILLALDLLLSRPARAWLVALAPAILLLPPLLRDRPLVGAFVYGFGQHGHEAAARIVDTGMLPVRLGARGGHSIVARPGQERLVRGVAPPHGMPFHLAVSAALPWWGWAAVAAVCLLPVLVSLLRGRLVGDRAAVPAVA